MITLPCHECGAAIVLPAEEVATLECVCGAVRRLKWFAGPRMWERWQNWVLFERPRLEQKAAR